MSAADDEVDALATRIEHIDELGAGDDATYGNDQWGLGAVLKQLIKSADVEGVREQLPCNHRKVRVAGRGKRTAAGLWECEMVGHQAADIKQ